MFPTLQQFIAAPFSEKQDLVAWILFLIFATTVIFAWYKILALIGEEL